MKFVLASDHVTKHALSELSEALLDFVKELTIPVCVYRAATFEIVYRNVAFKNAVNVFDTFTEDSEWHVKPVKGAEDYAIATQVDQRENLARMSLDQAFVGVTIANVDGKIVYCNPHWRSMYQLEENEPFEAYYDRLLPPESDEDCEANKLDHVLQSIKEKSTIQRLMRLHSGQIYAVLGCAVRDSDGHVVAYIGFTLDITDRVKKETAAANAQAELFRKNLVSERALAEASRFARLQALQQKAEQEELINTTSHEIRGPINSILQNAEMAQKSLQALQAMLTELCRDNHQLEALKDAAETLSQDVECLDAILECAQAQKRIADDILGLGSLSANQYSINPVPTHLENGLKTVLKSFEVECKMKKIALQLDLSEEVRQQGTFEIDMQRLAQVLTNLLANAIRFMPDHTTDAGDSERRVTCRAWTSQTPPDYSSEQHAQSDLLPDSPDQRDKCDKVNKRSNMPLTDPECFLCFEMCDTGIGLEPSEMSRLFRRFSQATPYTHTSYGGSGLGLFISMRLCMLMNGNITISSVKGQGARFPFYIQARRVATTPPVVTSLPTPASNPRSSSPRPRLRVLCVDDNAINRRILQRQLGQHGHMCDTAVDGLDALKQVQARDYDVVIMDTEMPLMDGIEATRQIRRLKGEKYARMRIVGCTGSIPKIPQALEAGQTLVVPKPYALNDLLNALHAPTSSTLLYVPTH